MYLNFVKVAEVGERKYRLAGSYQTKRVLIISKNYYVKGKLSLYYFGSFLKIWTLMNSLNNFIVFVFITHIQEALVERRL